MGWKLYLIIISNANNINVTDLPEKIGLNTLKPTKEISLLEAQYSHKTSIGKYGDNIYIVSDDLVFKFYDKEPSDFEKKISTAFPNSEIAVLTLNSTVDLYGFNIIKNGQRQRVKSGADFDLYIDIGNKLQEEVDISKEKIIDEEEIEEIKQDLSKEDFKKFFDKEVSIKVTFRLTKRYLEKEIDQEGSLIDQIKVTQYE